MGQKQRIRRKRRIHRRDCYTCQYCGTQLSRITATVDHVIPLSRGGGSKATNLVTACADCNTRKADRTPEQARMPLLSPPGPLPVVDTSFGHQRGFEGGE